MSSHGLSVFGATQMAQQRKQLNPNPNLIPNPNPNPNVDPNPIPHPKTNHKRLFLPLRRLRCAICVAPNTDSRI